MKVTLLDYILSSVLMSILWFIAGIFSFKILPQLIITFSDSYSAIISIFFFVTTYGLLSALLLRILITLKPLRQGTFDMDHDNFTYWKLLKMITEFGMHSLFILKPAPFKPILYSLFGCKIGKNVAIGGTIDTPFFVSIGDNSILGQGSIISADYVLKNKIVIGPVFINDNVTIGVNSLVLPNTFFHNGALVLPGSVVLEGSTIEENQTWKGNPARLWM